jgi:hypothetical protein
MEMKWATALLALLLPFASFPESKETIIQKVVEVTGISNQFSVISQMIEEQYKQQKAKIDNKTYGKIIAILYESFANANITIYIIKEIENDYNEDYCRHILKTYRRRLFIDITKSEIEFSQNFTFEKPEKFDYKSVKRPRDKLFEQYIDKVGYIEMQKRLFYSSIHTYITTYNLFLPEDRKMT